MWQLYVYSFLAGLIGANGAPHFIKGITGHKYLTPFNKSSSAVANVVWAWINFLVAALLLYYAHPRARGHELRALALLALGGLLASIALAAVSSANSKK